MNKCLFMMNFVDIVLGMDYHFYNNVELYGR